MIGVGNVYLSWSKRNNEEIPKIRENLNDWKKEKKKAREICKEEENHSKNLPCTRIYLGPEGL